VKKPYFTSITTFSLVITLVFSVIILNSTRITLQSEAQESASNTPTQAEEPACSMQVEVFIKEQLVDGSRVLLDFKKHPELDPLKWGFSDTINQLPYSNPPYVISFTHPTQAKYTNFVNELSFVAFPKQSQIYGSEEDTDISITYQDAYFDVVQQEIEMCSLEGTTDWLCSSDNVGDVETISGIPVKCGMNLSIGWIVAKTQSNTAGAKISQQFSQTKKVNTVISTDINKDGITSLLDLTTLISAYGSNDPQSDINEDGTVNGQDYVLMLEVLTGELVN
jgi:hypothetical protein